MTISTIFSELAESLRPLGASFDFELAPAASAEEIAGCEAALGMSLPPSYVSFLQEHNGADFGIDYKVDGLSPDVQLLGTDAIVDKQRRFAAYLADVDRRGETTQNSASTRFWSGLIMFATTGSSDCVFDAEQATGTEYAVLDFDDTDLAPTRDRVIAPSFTEWLERVVQSCRTDQNPVYWL
jgi:cell wall assembly regulator SMI1